jgi:hypothetical protein
MNPDARRLKSVAKWCHPDPEIAEGEGPCRNYV